MSDTLVYLYAVVPADAPEPSLAELTGVDGKPVRLVRFNGIAAPVSDVPTALYADAPLNGHLDDLEWVGARGLAHEKVLDWFMERGPVVPLSLFSLHSDEAHLRERLDAGAERFERLLAGLEGRREWGVRIWRHDDETAASLGELSSAIEALAREIAAAPEGRRYLLERKRDALEADEMRRVSARIVHGILRSLGEVADRASTMPIPPAPGANPRTLVCDAAFLVTGDGFPAFQDRLGRLSAEFRPYGFEFEFTGPWPPYHFVGSDVD